MTEIVPAELAPGRAMTDTEDKAFKQQALRLRSEGTPFDAPLQRWLDGYVAPKSTPPPARYVAGAAVRARVAAKQAMRDLSNVGLYGVLPPQSAPRPPGYAAGAAVKARVAQRVAERKARVEHLLAMRNSKPQRRGMIFCGGATFVSEKTRRAEAQAAREKKMEEHEAMELRLAKKKTIAMMNEMRSRGRRRA
ncbi:hypothetical protein B0H19DRAFT_1074239 [Mycena capillaripes]|nr:hypothetical protein B0H19DRAFT_1074239 [Mycena capillaripes]